MTGDFPYPKMVDWYMPPTSSYTYFSEPWAVVGKCDKCGLPLFARVGSFDVPKVERSCDCYPKKEASE